jgi:putative chitinase
MTNILGDLTLLGKLTEQPPVGELVNRSIFYNKVRKSVFAGTMTQDQVNGMGKILAYWEKNYKGDDLRNLAYVLATIHHETWFKMQPIEEAGGKAYLRKKAYYPWYGRGLVQITWKANYDKYGIKNPADALAWDTALFVTFDGMYTGTFTGRRLSQYFAGTKEDPCGARKIINGVDKDAVIAAIYTKFKDALLTATSK